MLKRTVTLAVSTAALLLAVGCSNDSGSTGPSGPPVPMDKITLEFYEFNCTWDCEGADEPNEGDFTLSLTASVADSNGSFQPVGATISEKISAGSGETILIDGKKLVFFVPRGAGQEWSLSVIVEENDGGPLPDAMSSSWTRFGFMDMTPLRWQPITGTNYIHTFNSGKRVGLGRHEATIRKRKVNWITGVTEEGCKFTYRWRITAEDVTGQTI